MKGNSYSCYTACRIQAKARQSCQGWRTRNNKYSTDSHRNGTDLESKYCFSILSTYVYLCMSIIYVYNILCKDIMLLDIIYTKEDIVNFFQISS